MLQSSSNFSNKYEIYIIFAVVILLFIGVAITVGFGFGNLIVLVIGGLVAFVLIYKRLAFGAAFILALAPLEGLIIFQGTSAVKLVTIFCVGILGLRILITQKTIVIDRIMVLIMIFVGWTFLSFLWSPDPMSNLSKWISFVFQIFTYFLLINLVISKDDLKLALWGHVVGGLILAVTLTSTMIGREFLRSENVAGLGLNLATRMVGLNLFLTMMLYQLENRRLAKGFLLISILISGIGAILGLSRGTWIGIVVSLLILVVLGIFRGKFNISAGQIFLWSLIGILLYVIVSNFLLTEHGLAKMTDRFESVLTLSNTAESRFEIWRVGGQLLAESPIFGHGYGTFKKEFAYSQSGQLQGAHNAYVLILVELGVVGLILFLPILFGVFIKLLQPIVKNLPNHKGAIWGMALFGFTLVATTVDSAIDRKYLWYIFSLLILIVNFWGENKSEKIGSHPRENN